MGDLRKAIDFFGPERSLGPTSLDLGYSGDHRIFSVDYWFVYLL